MSSLESLLTKIQESNSFWNFANNISTIEIVFQDTVFHKSKEGSFKSYELTLAQNCLIKAIPNSTNKVALLEKKIIAPFIELSDDAELLGFSISDGEISKCFYVENAEKLAQWLTAFMLLSGKFMRNSKDGINTQKSMLQLESQQISKEEAGERLLPWNMQNFTRESCSEIFCLKISKQEYLTSICASTSFSDDFTLLNEIGRGTTSIVYLAKSNSTDKQFAVKAINKEDLFRNDVGIENLLNEIKVMKKLNHPNAIKIHDVYDCPNHICLVLDYVEHGSLYSRVIKKKKFSEKTVAAFAEKLLNLLDYLSSLNVVHRDIKLENILMTSESNDYDFKLADFGLAIELNESSKAICGSPGYIAPEILRKLCYDFKADVFSSGAIFYILLSGKMPFSGKNPVEILRKNREGAISILNKNWSHVSKKGIRFVMKSMEPNPKLRPFAKELLNDPWLQRRHDESHCFHEKFLKEKSFGKINKKVKIEP